MELKRRKGDRKKEARSRTSEFLQKLPLDSWSAEMHNSSFSVTVENFIPSSHWKTSWKMHLVGEMSAAPSPKISHPNSSYIRGDTTDLKQQLTVGTNLKCQHFFYSKQAEKYCQMVSTVKSQLSSTA